LEARSAWGLMDKVSGVMKLCDRVTKSVIVRLSRPQRTACHPDDSRAVDPACSDKPDLFHQHSHTSVHRPNHRRAGGELTGGHQQAAEPVYRTVLNYPWNRAFARFAFARFKSISLR